MFHPPRQIEAEVYARLPEEVHRPGVETEFTKHHPGGLSHSVLEGPAFDRDGNLWCVDVPFGRVFRLSANGKFEVVAEYDGEPNGLAIHRSGQVVLADYKHGLMVLDDRNCVKPLLVRHNMEHFKAVNDLTFSSKGDLYFTDQGMTGLHDPSGRVFCLRANGRVECLLDNVPSPNGLALDLAEANLYIAATRDNAIWKVPLLSDGRMAKVGRFVQLSGGVGPTALPWMNKDGWRLRILAWAWSGFSPTGESRCFESTLQREC
jgi:gluconolactonase